MDSTVGATTTDLLGAFDEQVPAAPATQKRRMKSILLGLALAGIELETDAPTSPARSSVVRVGPMWAPISQTFAHLPVTRYPAGLRGRRDGWLLVLCGTLGLTRKEALAVTSADVALFPELTILGRPVPRADDTADCPACAIYRWLRVVRPASNGWRSDVREIVMATGQDQAAHDCQTGLDGQWRSVSYLAPAIDKHGWVHTGRALTILAVSNIVAVRQHLAGINRPVGPVLRVSSGRFDAATSAELAQAYDDVDTLAAELLARIAEVLGDGARLLGDGARLLGRVNDLRAPIEDPTTDIDIENEDENED